MLPRVNTPASALTVPSTPAGSIVTLTVAVFEVAPVAVTPTVTVPRAAGADRVLAAHAADPSSRRSNVKNRNTP
jgi:hypothetical protein